MVGDPVAAGGTVEGVSVAEPGGGAACCNMVVCVGAGGGT